MLFRKNKEEQKIDFQFIPRDKEAALKVSPPRPAKAYYPKYMREMPHSYKDNLNYDVPNTAIHCAPFIDTFTSGYIQELPCDLNIRYEGEEKDEKGDIVDVIRYRWTGDLAPMGTRAEELGSPNLFPRFDNYYHSEFHWLSMWEPKTPPGYSTMYTHPLNRFDLPFQTMSGIIDTDVWHLTGPVPFLIKKGFEGTIPAGTPIYQLTFIKRNEWHSSVGEYNEDETEKLRYKVRRTQEGYKKQLWIRKKFY